MSGITVRVFEQRGPLRLEEDLLDTDGLDFQRDIGVYICQGAPFPTYIVRAWVRPKEGQWREIRIGEMTQDERDKLIENERENPETASFLPAILTKTSDYPDSRGVFAQVTIPIRREGLAIGDNVRVEVRTNCDSRIDYPDCSIQVLNQFLTIDRYGLLTGFTDSILFVKRLGAGTSAVAAGIDATNYRPAPGFNFGLTYLHRKHPFLQFLEPGFGFNVSLVGWRDAALSSTGQLVSSTGEPIQVTVGAMGSMFDNVITVVYGWNTNVNTDRAFIGVGFSVVGVIRKVVRSSH